MGFLYDVSGPIVSSIKGSFACRSDVNAPTEALEQAVITCIKADQPVFFGEFGAVQLCLVTKIESEFRL